MHMLNPETIIILLCSISENFLSCCGYVVLVLPDVGEIISTLVRLYNEQCNAAFVYGFTVWCLGISGKASIYCPDLIAGEFSIILLTCALQIVEMSWGVSCCVGCLIWPILVTMVFIVDPLIILSLVNIQRLYDANAIDALLGCRTFSYWIYLIDNLSAQDYMLSRS